MFSVAWYRLIIIGGHVVVRQKLIPFLTTITPNHLIICLETDRVLGNILEIRQEVLRKLFCLFVPNVRKFATKDKGIVKANDCIL